MSEDKYPLVEVEWIDAGLESQHITVEEAKEIKPMLRKNAGYLVLTNNEETVLYFGSIEDKCNRVLDQTLVIPEGCIKNIKYL